MGRRMSALLVQRSVRCWRWREKGGLSLEGDGDGDGREDHGGHRIVTGGRECGMRGRGTIGFSSASGGKISKSVNQSGGFSMRSPAPSLWRRRRRSRADHRHQDIAATVSSPRCFPAAILWGCAITTTWVGYLHYLLHLHLVSSQKCRRHSAAMPPAAHLHHRHSHRRHWPAVHDSHAITSFTKPWRTVFPRWIKTSGAASLHVLHMFCVPHNPATACLAHTQS